MTSLERYGFRVVVEPVTLTPVEAELLHDLADLRDVVRDESARWAFAPRAVAAVALRGAEVQLRCLMAALTATPPLRIPLLAAAIDGRPLLDLICGIRYERVHVFGEEYRMSHPW